MVRKTTLIVVFFAAFGLLTANHQIAAQTRTRVRFARGASTTMVKGRIGGYKYVDYIVGVRAGQTLRLRLDTGNSAEMVVFTPSEENIEGATGVGEFVGKLEFTGDYKIRILQPRAFARRNNASNYTLRISIE